MNRIVYWAAILSVFVSYSTRAQEGCALDNIDLKVRVGYNIGGTTPIPLPASIRSIDAFRLAPSVSIGSDVDIHINDTWGVTTGLYFENKGLDADITTKGYKMEVKKGTSQISGLFTGHVKQKLTQWMLTLPIRATYGIGNKVTLKAGPYVSLLLSKSFSGIAYDGYIRQGNPTGPKIEIGSTETDWATYDFSEKMRSLQWGISLGIDWEIANRLGVSADLQWGLSGIFKSDFKTVEQTLYPIYGTLGIFYRLESSNNN